MSNRITISDEELGSMSSEQLRDLVARYRRIFNGSGYGFWEWDLTTHRIDWSGGFWESLGYGAEDQRRVADAHQLPDFIHPDDRENMLEAVRQHLRSGEQLYTSYRIRTKEGGYVWTQVRANSIRDQYGRALYISGVNFDITELKNVEAALRESEARQARIIQASNDGIWEWYADRGGFHFSNRCWEHLGYNEKDDLVNRGQNRLAVWRSHIHPQDLPKFDDTLASHMRGSGPFDIEYRIFGKEGDVRWIRARGRASFDATGKPVRMSGTNMDITDVKRAEERVMQAKETAEKANQAKSEFLSSMSHELRTPLNAIMGYAQLFEYDVNLPQRHMDNVREIYKAGQHLLQLINDVLDLAKIESGKMTVSLEPVLVSRVIADCFTLVQPQADAQGVKLDVSLNGLESSYVVADNVRLKQALINLISNAVKYNKVGGEVVVRMTEHQDNQLRISVRDTGQGIPANRQDEVFQPFNRLNAEQSAVEGSGVGLVITKQLVEMMAGKLSFESVEGKGTEFWIDLPLSTEWNQDLLAVSEPRTNEFQAAELNVEGPCRVLYVEDNPSNIRLLQQLFARYPELELDVAEEAFLGIYKARNDQPDVIILDINLPGMDGYEALSVLKRDPITAHIPVVGLSANAMPYDIERGKNAGFYDYLTKPVEINHLIHTLNQLLA
ncbi:PAS domain-containing protein [Marinimicrobium sp. ABcell2]|uniref:PAS domain-containing protein n=1 Tax=Marinimicrobium sp. ABcell2 TaxID=3069751 RepID=UPI0027B403D3|nr:PAS domain-containing protein [Marinimicrobium sp. ABcell2]MDQ2077251.1 PAS domain-containing protein [Marinimicrobium sp. ABcell2]